MAPRLIFVSYSRADSDLAVRISNELKQNSVNLWLDQLDIPAGAVWDMEIEKALGLCDCLLFIASKTSCASNNVLDEVYFALEQKKRIVPVKVDDCNIPFRIKRLQYIDISSDYSLGIENLLKTLSVEVKPVAITSEPAKGVKDESGESLDQEERLEWEWATTQNKKYAYDVYLNKYPNGKFKKKSIRDSGRF